MAALTRTSHMGHGHRNRSMCPAIPQRCQCRALPAANVHIRSKHNQQPGDQNPGDQAQWELWARSTLEPARQGAWHLTHVQGSTYGLVVAALMVYLAHAEPAAADTVQQQQHITSSLYDLAEGEEFWGNVAKYGRYFVTVMLGTGYVMVQPILAAFKKPVTAVAAVLAIAGGGILLKVTLDAMLGIQEPFSYEPGNIVPYSIN